MDGWQFDLLDLADITVVAIVLYFVLLLIRGTRAVQMLMGVAVVVLLYQLARYFGLLTVEWMFGHFFSAFIVILVVLFQHEIRRGLMRVGVNPLAAASAPHSGIVDAIVDACFALSHCNWGGLLVIERDTGLKHLFESGVEMDAPVRSDLIQALFSPQAPMHDGAVVIRPDREAGGRIVAGRVLLPLAQAESLSAHFGTRHRAAIGLTEESDALVIVVSEESGHVRLAEEGRLSEALDSTALRAELNKRLSQAQAVFMESGA